MVENKKGKTHNLRNTEQNKVDIQNLPEKLNHNCLERTECIRVLEKRGWSMIRACKGLKTAKNRQKQAKRLYRFANYIGKRQHFWESEDACLSGAIHLPDNKQVS